MTTPADDLHLVAEKLIGGTLDKRTLDELSDHLEAEERVHQLIIGSEVMAVGEAVDITTAILTNRRLLLVAEGVARHIYLKDISSLHVAKGVSLATLTVSTAVPSVVLQNVANPDIPGFIDPLSRNTEANIASEEQVVTHQSAAQELQWLDHLLDIGLLSNEQYLRLSEPLKQYLGVPVKDESASAAKIAALLGGGLLLLLLGGLLLFQPWADEDEARAPAPVQTQTVTPTPQPTAEQTEETSAPEPSPQPVETATETVEAQPPGQTEEPTAETTAPAEEDAADDQTQNEQYIDSAEAFEALVQEYLDDNGIDASILSSSTSPDAVTMEIGDFVADDIDQVENVSADIIELLAENNNIIEDPVHDAESLLSFSIDDQQGQTLSTFDRSQSRYEIELLETETAS